MLTAREPESIRSKPGTSEVTGATRLRSSAGMFVWGTMETRPIGDSPRAWCGRSADATRLWVSDPDSSGMRDETTRAERPKGSSPALRRTGSTISSVRNAMATGRSSMALVPLGTRAFTARKVAPSVA